MYSKKENIEYIPEHYVGDDGDKGDDGNGDDCDDVDGDVKMVSHVG